MGKFDALISQRAKTRDSSGKMAALAQQSASGNLTGFAGIFGVSELNDAERGWRVDNRDERRHCNLERR